MVKINEKIYIIAIIVLLIISGVAIFRSCHIHDYSGTDAGIRGKIDSTIGTAKYIIELHKELVSISDKLRSDLERLRNENIGLEQNIRELQEINDRLRDYKSNLEQEIRSIIESGNIIGDGITSIGKIIQSVRQSAQTETD